MQNESEKLRQRLRDVFDYNRQTGTLVWKKHFHARFIGKPAGHVKRIGYTFIMVDNKMYPAHTLIYLIETGELAKMIDHIDGDRNNNRIENLKPTNMRKNQQNRSTHRSGRLVGAKWHKRDQIWEASIFIKGRAKYLGRFATEKEAHISYLNALKEVDYEMMPRERFVP